MAADKPDSVKPHCPECGGNATNEAPDTSPWWHCPTHGAFVPAGTWLPTTPGTRVELLTDGRTKFTEHDGAVSWALDGFQLAAEVTVPYGASYVFGRAFPRGARFYMDHEEEQPHRPVQHLQVWTPVRWWTGRCREMAERLNFLVGQDFGNVTAAQVEQVLILAEEMAPDA